MPGRLREDAAAVSEVVGAILLVVIVSSAAFAFGLFVNQQQKKTQEQQAFEDGRRLEKVEVLSIAPTPNGGPTTALGIDLASLSAQQVRVTGIRINGAMQTAGTCSPSCTYPNLTLDARSQATVNFTGLSIPATQEIKIEILTDRGNHFTSAFLPPSAVILLDQQGSGNATVYTLDGGQSEAGGPNGFLVRYSWEIYAGACGTGAAPLTGKRVQYDPAPPSGGTYCIRLVVTDNVGLTGTRELTFSLS